MVVILEAANQGQSWRNVFISLALAFSFHLRFLFLNGIFCFLTQRCIHVHCRILQQFLNNILFLPIWCSSTTKCHFWNKSMLFGGFLHYAKWPCLDLHPPLLFFSHICWCSFPHRMFSFFFVFVFFKQYWHISGATNRIIAVGQSGVWCRGLNRGPYWKTALEYKSTVGKQHYNCSR